MNSESRNLRLEQKNGFSLVELSIVLVILGLIVGGILSGQSLIRAAELRAVTAEYQKYVAAAHTFEEKYNAIPGDMANAETYWGTLHAVDATCLDTAATGNTTATCNGDGDGSVEAVTTRSRETYRFWQHLVNAGLIEGQYTGTVVGGLHWATVLGVNSPKSKFAPGGWSIFCAEDIVTWGGWGNHMFPPSTPSWFEFGQTYPNGITNNPLLKPEEAWKMDTKSDDGMPGTGLITTFKNVLFPNCASSDTASTATYQTTLSGQDCVLFVGF